jgi:hypothetical protein
MVYRLRSRNSNGPSIDLRRIGLWIWGIDQVQLVTTQFKSVGKVMDEDK